jgi:hypothetical protein
MASFTIKQNDVRKMANAASQATGGAFNMLGIGADIGHGARYIDGRRQLVWVGKYAARKAAAYYFGVLRAMDNDGKLTERMDSELVDLGAFLVSWDASAVDAGSNDYRDSVRFAENYRR